jgi:hypothetical protein
MQVGCGTVQVGSAARARAGQPKGVRVVAALGVAALRVVSGWGVGGTRCCCPVPPLTLTNADAPHATFVALIVVFIIAMALIGPSFMLLLTLQSRRLLCAAEQATLPTGRAASGRAARAILRAPGLATRPAVLGVIRARRDQPPTESSLNRVSGTAEATIENICWAPRAGPGTTVKQASLELTMPSTPDRSENGC